MQLADGTQPSVVGIAPDVRAELCHEGMIPEGDSVLQQPVEGLAWNAPETTKEKRGLTIGPTDQSIGCARRSASRAPQTRTQGHSR